MYPLGEIVKLADEFATIVLFWDDVVLPWDDLAEDVREADDLAGE